MTTGMVLGCSPALLHAPPSFCDIRVLGHLLNTNKIRNESLVSFSLPLEITNSSNKKKKKKIEFHICAHTQAHWQLFWISIQ